MSLIKKLNEILAGHKNKNPNTPLHKAGKVSDTGKINNRIVEEEDEDYLNKIYSRHDIKNHGEDDE